MEKDNSTTTDDHHECTICLQSYVLDQGLLKCKHSFCYTCIEDWSKQENTCPLCKVRFSYIERVSKDNTDNNAVVGGKRKAKPKNKRTVIKKKSQSDARPVYGGRGVLNAQDAYMQQMLQSYIARQMQQHRHDMEEEDEEDDSDDDMGNYFMMSRHGGSLGHRHPGMFGRAATVDLTGNSSTNPINLMDEDVAPAPATVATRTFSSSSSSSNANNMSRSATIIDLADDEDDSGATNTTTSTNTTSNSNNSSSSSSAVPVDLTSFALDDVSPADRERIYELLEDELDALDEDYVTVHGQSDDEEEVDEEEEEGIGLFVERVLGRNGTVVTVSSGTRGGPAARASVSHSNSRSNLSPQGVARPLVTASNSGVTRASSVPVRRGSTLIRSGSAPPVRARRGPIRSVTPSPPPPNTSSSSNNNITNDNSNISNNNSSDSNNISGNNSDGRVTRTRSLQK